MSNRLADSLQLWGFEGDFVIFSDGSLGFGLEATPIDISCWENGRVNDLVQRTGQFLNGFLMAQDDRAVVAIESTPLEYWIATTDPRDLGQVEEIRKKEPDKTSLEILKILSEKYPTGVAAAGGAK